MAVVVGSHSDHGLSGGNFDGDRRALAHGKTAGYDEGGAVTPASRG